VNRFAAALMLTLLGGVNAASARETGATGRHWLFLDDDPIPAGQLDRQLDSLARTLTPRALARRVKSIARTPPVRACDLGPSQERLRDIDATGCRIIVVARYLNAVSVGGPSEALHCAARLSFVRTSRPVRSLLREVELPPTPSEVTISTYYIPQFAEYGRSWTPLSMVNIPEVHNEGLRGRGILIGVQDTGFDRLRHRAFRDLNVAAAWDFVNNDANVGDEDDAGSGRHGTRTLSLLAGNDRGSFIGAAPEATYVLTKTENTDSERPIEEDYWVAGLWFCDSLGVDVISSSLTYRDWYQYADFDGETAVTTRAADSAAAAGIVIVNSIGNTGGRVWPGNKMGAPADGRLVLTIGGTNRDSTWWASASQGPTYDGRIKPDLATLSQSVPVAASYDDSSYTASNGTSFATPVVAGIVALMFQANPELTVDQVFDIVRRTAHQAHRPDTLTGWGVPDALAAVRMARQLSAPVTPGWEVPAEPFLTAFPNPFNGFLTVRLRQPLPGEFKVFDAAGRIVRPLTYGDRQTIRLDFSMLPAGTYHLLPRPDGTAARVRLLK